VRGKYKEIKLLGQQMIFQFFVDFAVFCGFFKKNIVLNLKTEYLNTA